MTGKRISEWVERWDEIGWETSRGDYGPDAKLPLRSRIAHFLTRWIGYR